MKYVPIQVYPESKASFSTAKAEYVQKKGSFINASDFLEILLADHRKIEAIRGSKEDE